MLMALTLHVPPEHLIVMVTRIHLGLLWILVCTGSALELVSAKGQPPVFTIEPQSSIVKVSSPITLECRTSPEGSTIRWLYNGKKITSSASVEIKDGRLVIQSFKQSTRGNPGHEGMYQCVATNKAGGVISRESKLEAAFLGDFYSGYDDKYVNVTEGNVAFIQCSPPVGQPRAVISYELNGTEIDTKTSNRHIILPSGNLQISNAHRRDQGKYRCVAYNSISNQRRRATHVTHLTVHAPVTNHPPVFVWVPPSDAEVIQGHNLTLECVVEGAPVPVVTWSKYGGKLPEESYTQVLGNLILYNAGRLDEGTYICSANNGFGPTQVAIALVDVQEPPTIILPPANQVITLGSSATFECEGRGHPGVTTKWYHNGQPLRSLEGALSVQDTKVTIHRVTPSDGGVFQCLVHSGLGSVTAAAILTVLKPGEVTPPGGREPGDSTDVIQGTSPDLDHVHPLITQLPQNTTISEGGATVLSCHTRQQEQVEYGDNFLWLKNANPIDRIVIIDSDAARQAALKSFRRRSSSRRGMSYSRDSTNQRSASEFRFLPSGSLQLINAHIEDDGEYKCVIRIAGILDSAAAYLTVLPLENQDKTPSGDSNPDHFLEGSTNPISRDDPNIDDDGVMQISDDEERNNRRKKKGKKKNKKNRNNNEDFDANNDRNEDPLEEIDLEMKPPSKPEVSKLSDTSVILEWSMPDDSGLPITFFKVQYKEMVDDSNRRRWRTIDEDIPSHMWQFEVSNLKPGMTYRFRIVGVYTNNDNLSGPNSKKFTMEMGPVDPVQAPVEGPFIVESTMSTNGINLNWQYIPVELAPIQGFNIYYQIYTSDGKYRRFEVQGDDMREAELLRLMPSTIYSIKMTAFNSIGESAYSNTVTQTTPDFDYDYPEWPVILPGNSQPDTLITSTTTTAPSSGEVEITLSTKTSNKLLYIILGCVLGILVLALLIFMGICAWKQRQRARMLAAMEGQNKFHDPSRVIYAQDSIRKKQLNGNGNGFLLNGLNGPEDSTTGNGSVSSYPRMNIMSNPMTEGADQASVSYTGANDESREENESIQELRASLQEMLQQPLPLPPTNSHSTRNSQLLDCEGDNGSHYDPRMGTFGRSGHLHHQLDPHLYENPADFPSNSQRSLALRRSHDQTPSPYLSSHDQPSYHDSWRSNNSIRTGVGPGHRIHDPHKTDHIPRSHEHKTDHIPRSHERHHYHTPDLMGHMAGDTLPRGGDTLGRGIGLDGIIPVEQSYNPSPQVSSKQNHRRKSPSDVDLAALQCMSIENGAVPHSDLSGCHNRLLPILPGSHGNQTPSSHNNSLDINVSMDSRDYETIDDSTEYERRDSDPTRALLETELRITTSDEESLSGTNGTPPLLLPRLPRVNDYPASDPDDE